MSQCQTSRQRVILLLRLALLATVAGLWSGCASAQLAPDIPHGKLIHIHMKGSRTNPTGSNPYRIDKVLPNSKGICRGASNQRDDCYSDVAWQLKGTDLPVGWYVEVRIKVDGPKKCFPDAPYKIASDEPVDSGPADEKVCARWDVWPYDVILFDSSGTEKGREDPLVVFNH
jgi:hypothetical protein